MLRLHRRLLLVVFALLVAATLTFAQESGTPSTLRFAHVTPGAPPVDIYTDGELTITNLDYGQASGYVQVEPGAHAVTVTQNGETNALWEQEINTAPGMALTLVASAADPLGFQVYQDDLNPLALGTARLTAIHAISGSDALDVLLTDGRAMMPGLQYDVPYGTLDIPAAFYDIAVVSEGASVEDAILPTATLELSSGVSYMAVIYGTEDEPSWLLLSATAQAEGDAGYVRFVNGTANTGIDVSLNDTLVVPALNQRDPATSYMALPVGSYDLVVNTSGESDGLISDSFEITAGDRVTFVYLESDEGALLRPYEDPVTTITADESVVSVINALPEDGTVTISAGEATVLGSVAAGENGSAILEPGETPLSATVTVDDEPQTTALQDVVYGGVYYSVLAVESADGAQAILLGPVSLAQGPASAPGNSTLEVAAPSGGEEVSTPETIATESPSEATEEVPAAATEIATEVVAEGTVEAQPTPAPVAVSGPSARVLLNEGANLHIRQFPSSNALSLVLVPANSRLQVLGRQGAPVLDAEETPEPEATEYVDPVALLSGENADLNPADTWLFVSYALPQGSDITGGVTTLVETTGWANALFLAVSDAAGRPMRLADLPAVPSNRAGQTTESSAAPVPTSTPIAADSVIATVLLNEGANLHLRRNPDAAAESLALVPNGAQLVVTGRIESGEWLQVSYEGREGWVASLYVTLSLNGVPYQSAQVPVISTPTPTATVEATPAV